jgi:hypothetical protein
MAKLAPATDGKPLLCGKGPRDAFKRRALVAACAGCAQRALHFIGRQAADSYASLAGRRD